MKTLNWLRERPDLLIVIGLGLIVFLLWLPFGLNTLPGFEGWFVMAVADDEGFYAPYFEWNGRPLVPIPWKIASLLIPHPFIGINLMLALVFFGKAVLVYLILKNLEIGSPGTRFLAAVLFMLFPADDANFAVRITHYHYGLFFYLVAAYGMSAYRVKSRPVYWAAATALALLVSCLIYEVVLPLALFTPLIVLLSKKIPRVEKIQIVGFWYTALIGFLIFYFTRPLPYQSSRFGAGLLSGEFVIEVVRSFFQAYRHSFLDSWVTAFAGLFNNPAYIVFALLIGLAAGLIVYWLSNHRIDLAATRARSHLRAVLLGVVVFGLGFSLYTLADTRDATFRVFYYASVGGGIALASILALASIKLGRYQGLTLAGASFVFVLVAANAGLEQQAGFVGDSHRQRQALASLVEQAPAVEQEITLIVFMDKLTDRPFPNNRVFTGAVNWVYDIDNWVYGMDSLLNGLTYSMDLSVRMCYLDRGNCITGEKEIVVDDFQQPNLSGNFPAERVIIFRYSPAFGMELAEEFPDLQDYAPNALINLNAPPAFRAQYLIEN